MNYSKVIATVVGAVVSVLVAFNVNVDSELQAAIIVVLTAFATFVAPANKPS